MPWDAMSPTHPARPTALTLASVACPTQSLVNSLAPDTLLVTFALGTPVEEVVAATSGSVFTTAAIWCREAHKHEVEPAGACFGAAPGRLCVPRSPG